MSLLTVTYFKVLYFCLQELCQWLQYAFFNVIDLEQGRGGVHGLGISGFNTALYVWPRLGKTFGAKSYCQLTNLVLKARLVCKASVKDRIMLFEKSESDRIEVDMGEQAVSVFG